MYYECMVLNEATCWRAVTERDKSYDGTFYFATKSNGIFCRPSCVCVCPAQKACLFFATTDDARLAGYRACRYCHPDRVKRRLSLAILERIEAGEINDRGVRGLADSLHISERHLRRIVKDRTGTSPTHLAQAKRLATAKRLVTQTSLSITDVAFSSEFSSLRQFNTVFKRAFLMSPREMRKTALKNREVSNDSVAFLLKLAYEKFTRSLAALSTNYKGRA